MRLWAILAAILVSTLVLAGCSDKKDDGGDTSSSSSSTSRASTPGTTTAPPTTSASTPTQPPTGPPGEPDNTAPSGSIAAVPANASILPRTINFTLNGTDAEGDNIVWDFTFGDGNATSGALLPANASHQYAAVGLYNVTFTISDGRLQTTYNLTVNVTAGGGGGTLFTFAGSVEMWCMGCDDAAAEGAPVIPAFSWFSGEQGLDAIFSPLTPDLAGHPYTIAATADDPGGAFVDACSPDGAIVAATADEGGVVPAGAGCIVLWTFPGGPAPPGTSTIGFEVTA